MIYLETDRLILRDYVTGDFDDYYRLMTDDQTMYYMKDIKLDSIESGTYNDKEDRILLDMKSGRQHQVYSHDKIYIKDTENNITKEIKVSEIEDYI